MKELTENWYSEGLLDFEYKKYILLAYLKEINTSFKNQELYPPLANLIQHYNNLVQYKYQSEQLQNGFPEQLVGIDFSKNSLKFKKTLQREVLIEEINNIVEYAIDEIKLTLNSGKDIYEYVEKQLNIEPIGLQPLDNNEGYFMVHCSKQPEILIFQYQMSIYQNASDVYRCINTKYHSTQSYSISNSYQNLKIGLIKQPPMPNPAVYLISTDIAYPLQATILPVARRSLVAYLSHK